MKNNRSNGVMRSSILGTCPGCYVEYDRHGARVVKWFDDPYKARRFYGQKLLGKKNPRVRASV